MQPFLLGEAVPPNCIQICYNLTLLCQSIVVLPLNVWSGAFPQLVKAWGSSGIRMSHKCTFTTILIRETLLCVNNTQNSSTWAVFSGILTNIAVVVGALVSTHLYMFHLNRRDPCYQTQYFQACLNCFSGTRCTPGPDSDTFTTRDKWGKPGSIILLDIPRLSPWRSMVCDSMDLTVSFEGIQRKQRKHRLSNRAKHSADCNNVVQDV